MRLVNVTRHSNVSTNLMKTRGLFSRAKGLIGSDPLTYDEALWIPACNSIHTFFMTFPIDVVFTDKNFKVKSIFHTVTPWRLLPPQWGAFHTFEFSAGRLSNIEIEPGDILNVVD